MTDVPPPEPTCVFCAIVAGRAPASPVFADDRVLAFLDIRPVTPGHLLVVPRAHAASLEDLDADLGAHVFRVGHRIARALRRSSVPCEGVNLFLADGAVAGQEVFHVHLHVLPRTRGDGFSLDVRWTTPPREALDLTAADVRAGLAALDGASPG